MQILQEIQTQATQNLNNLLYENAMLKELVKELTDNRRTRHLQIKQMRGEIICKTCVNNSCDGDDTHCEYWSDCVHNDWMHWDYTPYADYLRGTS